MSNRHYSTSRARSSLLQFAAGKGLTALMGFAVLLLSVRILSTGEYGLYVAAVAFVEIFYLITGFGLSTVAQRYVAEFRVKTTGREFTAFLYRILIKRFCYALAGAIVVGIVFSIWPRLGGQSTSFAREPVFYVLLVFGCCIRYAYEIFPALLLQGYVQSVVLAVHIFRIAGLLGCMALAIAVDFKIMLLIEVAGSIVGTIGSLLLLRRYLTPDRTLAPNSRAAYSNQAMQKVASRFYVVQLLGQAWSPNTCKLIVAQSLGLEATATYGFVQSIIDILRNYLPAYLLSTWLRPLMIARYLEKGSLHEVNVMASLIFKLSLICIVPVASYFLVSGDSFIASVSGGKVNATPSLLLAFCALLMLQCLHVVTGMVTMTLERAGVSVIATAVACVGFPLSVAGAHYAGILGVVFAMTVAELVWIGMVISLLRRDGLKIRLDVRGGLLIAASAAPTYFAVKMIMAANTWPPIWHSAAGFALAGISVAALNALWRPFNQSERDFVYRLIPKKYFIW